MTALDVISVEQAKAYLRVDFDTDDDLITSLIQTSVAWVEQYTCYRLFERVELFIAYNCKTGLPYYPIEVTSVEYDGDEQDIVTKNRPLELVVECKKDSVITATVGYSDVADIPAPLLTACYKLITYLYENRDAYGATLPVDVQLLINQYRRSATI